MPLIVTLVPTAPIVGVNPLMVGGAGTVTRKFGEYSPNHSTLSRTIRHWKLYVPGTVGAVTVKLKTTSAPGATDEGGFTRLNPQVVLSCAFCDPSR